MRTLLRDGYLCEIGPQSILDGAPDTEMLLQELDLHDEIVRPSPSARRRMIFVRGQLRAVPQDPLSLLSSDLLSTAGKWRLLREPFVKARAGADADDDADESVLEFGTRRLGLEAARSLVAPATIGIFAGDAAALSLKSAFPRLAALEARHGSLLKGLRASRREGAVAGGMFSFRRGLEQLPQALAKGLGAHLVAQNVRSIGRDSRGWSVTLDGTGTAGELGDRADALILTTPAGATAALLSRLVPTAADELRRIPLAPVAVVWLGFARRDIGINLQAYGFLVARGEGKHLLGCQYESSVFAGRAPTGGVLLRVIVGGVFDPDALALSDDALVARCVAELREIAALTVDPGFSGVWRHAAAIPQYQVGHAKRAAAVQQAVSAHAGLHVQGSFLGGVSVNDCIRNAAKLAGHVTRTTSL